MEPLGVPDRPAGAARQGMRVVLLQPAVDVEVVELLRPEHAGEGLPVDAAFVLAERRRRNPIVELVGIGEAVLADLLEGLAERLALGPGGEPQPHDFAPAGRHVDDVVGRGLRAGLRGVHGATIPANHVAVEGVLDVRRRVRLPPESLRVALVLREEQLGAAAARERVVAEIRM